MGIKGQPFVDPVVDVPVARPPGQFEYLCQNEPVWFRVPVSDPDPVVEPEAVAKVDWIEPARVRSLLFYGDPTAAEAEQAAQLCGVGGEYSRIGNGESNSTSRSTGAGGRGSFTTYTSNP